ncbi:hypothetical protein EV702DRAFT_1192789 [Suillus placidus]|uniref:Uncharacterized protein n=1 Tax=Suillus placidus TaxID=48579 RepID=A0A9P7D7Q6_9AGAM|nr:hypothetical protein EV702DRAFT_1192789 [Suillus placidus]
MAPTDQPLREQDVGTFSALALVCRFFCSVALPRVFERITFSGDMNGNRTQASRKTKWARQIVANTEPAKSVALYVKECTFVRWDPNKEAKWILFPFATLYCQAMACMSNIRKVVFSTSFVKKDHWEALAELKQLDVLEFRFCSFIEDPSDKELTVRTVMLFGTRGSTTTFTLRPIATTSMRSLDADDVEAVLKVVAFRQLDIDNLVLNQRIFDMEPLLHVFRCLPGLQSVTFGLTKASPLIGKLSLKKLFTRLHSFTIKGTDFIVPQHDVEVLVSALCDGPGTLPSLEELNLYFITAGEWTTTLDVISDRLNGTIIPAFPNRATGKYTTRIEVE